MNFVYKFLLYSLVTASTVLIVKILPMFHMSQDQSPYLAACLLLYTGAYWLGYMNKR